MDGKDQLLVLCLVSVLLLIVGLPVIVRLVIALARRGIHLRIPPRRSSHNDKVGITSGSTKR